MTTPNHMKNIYKVLQQEIVETNEYINSIEQSILRLEKRFKKSQKRKGYEHPATIARVISHQRNAIVCLRQRLQYDKEKAAALQI